LKNNSLKKINMKRALFFIISILIPSILSATHNRAGEITYRHLSGYTYEITLITYTYTPSAANESRDLLTMVWGDDSSSEIQRMDIDYLPDDYQRNTYIGQHTFPGPGVYEMSMSDPNRNDGVLNIPGSVNVVFTVKTTLKIDPTLGFNNTPVMLNPPIDKAAKDILFIHNPSAFDADGDSLSFKMATCLGESGLPIQGYMLPPASNSIYVDAVTGDLVWDKPTTIGKYNVAIEIEEWRDGIKIGSIIRDMQIEVQETDNHPPVIAPLADICVTAGNTVEFQVTANDEDNDYITLNATGGPFNVSPEIAVFPQTSAMGSVTSTFFWQTNCLHVRKLPLTVLFRAQDDHPSVSLTDYKDVMITVNAPAPENLNAVPSNSTVVLTWTPTGCTNATGYRIFRRMESFAFVPAECETGVPEYTGYTQIKELSGSDKNSFVDDNNGAGLTQGYTYCYRIVSYFADGAESYTSNEICAELVRSTPVFIENTVAYTDENKGSIHLKWLKPEGLNAVQYPPPYKYQLSESPDLNGQFYGTPIDIFGIDNTFYVDTLINTVQTSHIYKLILMNETTNGWEQIGAPAYASSVFTEGKADDRKMKIISSENVPWQNSQYILYRKNADELCTKNTTPYDSISFSSEKEITDFNLENGTWYWYRVKTVGNYDLDYLPKNLINFSQEICVSPSDTIPPCPPKLTVKSDCDLLQNTLTWQLTDTCSADIAKFVIYYSNTQNGALAVLTEINDRTVRSFVHTPEGSLAGCYALAAVDSVGNFIGPEQLVKICVDNCNYYSLPNVITPNGDGDNDLFIPFPYKFVEKIELKIYNRWGNLVFETQNPDINWDGTDYKSKQPVSDGVYYYLCDVYEYRLSGIVPRNIAGFVQIIGNKKTETGK
jgi:gliding motility-associated-like protein